MDSDTLVTLTADIVSAHVSNNNVPISDVATLVQRVHDALAGLHDKPAAEPERPQAIMSVRSSIRPDHLVCLVCGAKQRTLKRHLATAHNLNPAEYRERYDLRADYPMSAPNYSQQRREMALRIGLGQKAKRARKAPAKSARKPKAKTAT